MSTTKSKTRSSSNRETPSRAAMPDPNAQLFQTVVRANTRTMQAWYDGWTRFLTDATEFTSRRLGRDLEAVHALWSCQTPAEAWQVQTRFVQKAVKDYIREVTRLGDIETDTGIASIEALDRGVREAETEDAGRGA